MASHAPNDPSLVKIMSQPYPKRGIGASFQKRPVLMMQIWVVLGDPKIPQKSFRAVGIRLGARVNFRAVVGWGPGGARGETEV